MRVILASGSPRRRELLAAAGVAFEVIISPAEEIHDAAIPLAELCERNAELKAAAVAAVQQGAVVIGADTAPGDSGFEVPSSFFGFFVDVKC